MRVTYCVKWIAHLQQDAHVALGLELAGHKSGLAVDLALGDAQPHVGRGLDHQVGGVGRAVVVGAGSIGNHQMGGELLVAAYFVLNGGFEVAGRCCVKGRWHSLDHFLGAVDVLNFRHCFLRLLARGGGLVWVG